MTLTLREKTVVFVVVFGQIATLIYLLATRANAPAPTHVTAPVVTKQAPATMTTPTWTEGGLAPGHVEGKGAFIAKAEPEVRRRLKSADLVWLPSKTLARCYVVLELPTYAFVDVPDEFCEGMR